MSAEVVTTGQESADERVFVVVYGEVIHVYPASHEACAVVLFTVGVGAGLDSEMYRLRPQRWAAVRKRLPRGISVITHN